MPSIAGEQIVAVQSTTTERTSNRFGPNVLKMMKGDSVPGMREPQGQVMEGQMRGLCTDQHLCPTNRRKLQRHLGIL
jgi:hypothetical protein